VRCFMVSHDGVALGGISIAFAENAEDAADRVRDYLKDLGHSWEVYDAEEVIVDQSGGAALLWNGDY
jgi:hypothetical protein